MEGEWCRVKGEWYRAARTVSRAKNTEMRQCVSLIFTVLPITLYVYDRFEWEKFHWDERLLG